MAPRRGVVSAVGQTDHPFDAVPCGGSPTESLNGGPTQTSAAFQHRRGYWSPSNVPEEQETKLRLFGEEQGFAASSISTPRLLLRVTRARVHQRLQAAESGDG